MGEGSSRKSQPLPLPFPHSGKSQRLASYFVLNTGSQSKAEGLGRQEAPQEGTGRGATGRLLLGEGSRTHGLPEPPGDPPACPGPPGPEPWVAVTLLGRTSKSGCPRDHGERGLRAAPRGWKGAPLQERVCFCFVDRALPRCPWQLLVCAVGPFSR